MKYLGSKYFGVILCVFCLIVWQYGAVGQDIKQNFSISDSLKNLDKRNVADFKFDDVKDNSGKDSVKKASNILDLLEIDDKLRYHAWHLDSETYDLIGDPAVDTVFFMPHLIIPFQNHLMTLTHLGNLGSPIEPDYFFDRKMNSPFLFTKGYDVYKHEIVSNKQYNVKSPLTLIEYSTGGKRKEAEQVLKFFHTQNVNPYLNFGLRYDYYNAKGIYQNQLTRDNVFTAFGSYYKNRVSAQATFGYNYIRNQENGGVADDRYVQDTVMESLLIPVKLDNSSIEYRQKSFAVVAGYDILVRNVKLKTKSGADTSVVKPLLTGKVLFDAYRYTKVYADEESDSSYYQNFYINASKTHDSVYLATYNTTLLVELTQLAKFPGLPGLRFWVSHTSGNYNYFEPNDFIYDRPNDKIKTNHVGAGIYSFSPYLSYSGALRLYIDGYRSNDKELLGQITISPWKSTEMPYIKGKLIISDKEPDIFIQNYFSNHYKWSNNFDKEKWFMVGGVLGAEKWKFEIGYNLVRIVNYLYFDTKGLPAQDDGVTVTSAYAQKTFKLGGLHFVNKVLWQANSNKDVLNLPDFSIFSSLYYEHVLVKNALVGQLGLSGFYRTKFYADGYIPATGQFINQREKKIGDYPFIDAFVNFKWKRTILFFKFDHVNEGNPNSEYFTALHYPANRRVFKFGLSWIFYD